jgi:hypothetical protein
MGGSRYRQLMNRKYNIMVDDDWIEPLEDNIDVIVEE